MTIRATRSSTGWKTQSGLTNCEGPSASNLLATAYYHECARLLSNRRNCASTAPATNIGPRWLAGEDRGCQALREPFKEQQNLGGFEERAASRVVFIGVSHDLT